MNKSDKWFLLKRNYYKPKLKNNGNQFKIADV